MNCEFYNSPTGGTMLVGELEHVGNVYVGSYFRVRYDKKNPWRVMICHSNPERWEAVDAKNEDTARRILVAAWICTVAMRSKAAKGAKNGKVV